MTFDTRRFYYCLLATTFAALLLLPLTGLLWPRSETRASSQHARIKLMTLVLPHVPTPRLRVAPHTKTEHKISALQHIPPGAQVKRVASISLTSASSARVVKLAKIPRKVKAQKTALLSASKALPVPRLTPPPPMAVVPKMTAPVTTAPAAVGVLLGSASAPGEAGSSGNPGKNGDSGDGRGGKNQGSGGEPFGVGTGLPGLGGPRHVVYVLDISGSMTSRIDRARDELRKTLTGLGPDETFDIVVFSDEAAPFTASLISASAINVARANHFLGSVRVDGGTNLEAAMREALELADVNEVVLLTDGVPTLGETDFGKLAREIQRLNKSHARISAVGLLGQNPDGTDDSFEAEGLLRQITRSSGGSSQIVRLGTKSP